MGSNEGGSARLCGRWPRSDRAEKATWARREDFCDRALASITHDKQRDHRLPKLPAAATGTAGLVLGALYLHSSGLVFPKMLAVWKQLVIEHADQVHRDGHFTALMHNLTSGVPDAATCAHTEVAKGDQVERCRAVWIAADPCSPLRNTHQDQHQYRSNTEV